MTKPLAEQGPRSSARSRHCSRPHASTRRAAKPEHDREDDERRGGKELRLPVLEGFEPEAHVPEVGDERMLGASMQGRFSHGCPVASPEMQDERGNEEASQSDAQRVGVEEAHEAARGGRGWRVRSFLFLPVRIPGLGRSALEQERGQNHVGRHLQEFALPILEDRGCEVAASEVRQQPERSAAMLDEKRVVRFPSRQAHRHDG